MRIESAVNSNYQMNVPNKAAKADAAQQFSASEIKEIMLEESSVVAKEFPELLAFNQFWQMVPNIFTDEDAQDIASLVSEGKTASDWFQMLDQSGKARKISQVTYSVLTINPKDEKYYNVWFTDNNKVRCNACNEEGTLVWELDINDEDWEKVNNYFKQFKPCPWYEIYYSDSDNGTRMGMATLKDFWLELFKK